MVVGIDNISPGESTSKAALGGMRNYLQDLLDLLPAQRPDWRFKLFTPAWADPFELQPFPNLEVVPCNIGRGRLARVAYEQFRLPAAIQSTGVDVWLGSCNTLPLWAKCRKALVIQSLQYFSHASTYSRTQRSYLRAAVSRSVHAADRVIALSAASKAEIIARFGVPEAKVDIVHHGLHGHLRVSQPSGDDDDAVRRLLGDAAPFVLIVSALYPYKNHARLIEAFARIHAEFPGHRLVIVGADSPGLTAADLRLTATQRGVAESVFTLGRLSSADLASFYRRAEVMCMPSLEETFGLTVLEAMHFGCPVITSNLSSMAEVGAGAALLVDPLDVGGLADALRRALGDPAVRATMTAAGLERAACFSKERMVENTIRTIFAAGEGGRGGTINSPRKSND